MFRATNSPIIRSTFDRIYSFGTMHWYCSNIGALYQSCIYSQKCSWWWASFSPKTCTADSNRSIERSISENCCILLVAYIVVQIVSFSCWCKTSTTQLTKQISVQNRILPCSQKRHHNSSHGGNQQQDHLENSKHNVDEFNYQSTCIRIVNAFQSHILLVLLLLMFHLWNLLHLTSR